MKNVSRIALSALVAVFAAVVPAGYASACAEGPPIVFVNPEPYSDIGEGAREVTIRWRLEGRKCPVWGVEVWCASDNERIFDGKVKESPTGTNEVKVAGLKPNRLYYVKVVRNWARIKECLFTTGALPSVKASAMPGRFRDRSRYDIVDMPRGEAFDLALTRFRGFTRGVSLCRASPSRFVATVPCEQYTRAWVLCSVDPDASKDKAFTLRLTRYVTMPWRKMRGRSLDATCNMRVDLSEGAGAKITGLDGGLLLVEVPLDTGNIQDVIFSDRNGDWNELKDVLARKGLDNYLDFEIMGRTPAERSSVVDGGADTDFRYTSAVTVHGVALEKPDAEFQTECVQPGNVFENDETPEVVAKVTVKRPGEYTLSVEASDVDGRIAGKVVRRLTESGEYRVGLPVSGPGWYGLKWRLSREGGAPVTCSSTAAVLGRDTRTAGMGDGYGTWSFLGPWGSHGYPKMVDKEGTDYICTILRKGGFRQTLIQQPPADEEERIKHYKGNKNTLTDEECRYFKLGAPTVVSYPRDWREIRIKGGKDGEEKLAAVIEARLKRNPKCLVAKLFHEHATVGSVAPEAFGFPAVGKEIKASAGLVPGAVDFCRFLRRRFPQITIVAGNSGSSSAFIAQLARNGLSEELVDKMGTEVVGGEILPEFPTASGMLGAEHFRALARNMGLDWGIDQCFESNMRQDRVLGGELQASFYVRDILLSLVWGFKTIWVGAVADPANHYNFSQWGNIGLCSRYPFLYPKKAYVATATATKVLDRVVGLRKIPTGEECVYAVEYRRADGRSTTAFWTSRGEAALSVGLAAGCKAGDLELIDMYGRTAAFKGDVRAGSRIMYLVGKPGSVASVSIVSRSFPGDARPADYTPVVTCDDVSLWRTADAPVTVGGLELDLEKRRSWPHRTFTKAVVREVDDPEMGRCMELELPDDGNSISPMHYRYNEIALRRPVRIGRAFKSIGATIKGNSGWGDVLYILEDSRGRRSYSGYTRNQGVMDRYCHSVVNYSGWNFLRMFVRDGSSVRELKNGRPDWAWSNPEVAEDPDVKLVGIAFSARMKPLYLDETKPCRQVIRIKDIGVFD